MSTRILLFTGKGGVGKTTCAAATALHAAEQGRRTLILSSDPAHSLADALDMPLGPEPLEVRPGLFAQEVNLFYSMKKYWANMRDVMLMVLKWQGVGEIAAEELAALPGMGEASAMLWLDHFYHSGEYDLIVVDSAPHGRDADLPDAPPGHRVVDHQGVPLPEVRHQNVRPGGPDHHRHPDRQGL
jgi:arsenite-transporting ATPase